MQADKESLWWIWHPPSPEWPARATNTRRYLVLMTHPKVCNVILPFSIVNVSVANS